MPPWKGMIEPDAVDIVSPEGEVRCRVQAYYAGNMFVTDDMSVDVRPGDEIRRRLPNGNEEAFHVDDPKFYGSGGFGKHYQIKVSRQKVHPPKTGGNYAVHVSGANARVNIHSTDNSTNIVHTVSVFNDAREIVAKTALQPARVEEVGSQIDAMEAARTQPKFVEAYQKFIGLTADHIAVFGPIIAALGTVLATLPQH